VESQSPKAAKESLAMHIEVRRGGYMEVEAMRELYREDARCQMPTPRCTEDLRTLTSCSSTGTWLAGK
jgi:hypothetical protein